MRFRWEAQYHDGTVVKQIDEARTPREISSEQLDRKKLKAFALLREDGVPVLTLVLEEGQRFIYRKRTERQQSTGASQACHLVGWQKTVAGENVQSIAYCFEDGRIFLAGKWRDDHPWFYAPSYVPAEVEDGWC